MSNWVYIKLLHEIDVFFQYSYGYIYTQALIEFHNNLDNSRRELYDALQADDLVIMLLI